MRKSCPSRSLWLSLEKGMIRSNSLAKFSMLSMRYAKVASFLIGLIESKIDSSPLFISPTIIFELKSE
jgi:hypothetical protein